MDTQPRQAPARERGREVGDWFVTAVADGSLDLPRPGGGATLRRLEALAALGRVDPVRARLGEGHADAHAVLDELGAAVDRTGRWGVWAADPTGVRAVQVDGRWRLTGRRPFCSGAGICTRALVCAAAPDGIRLFAVQVDGEPRVRALPGTWPALGMADSDSRTVEFMAARAEPVGGPGAYTARPGFAHGAVGVAACWFGGAVGVADLLRDPATDGDPHTLAHLGGVDAALTAAAAVLTQAAGWIDAHPREQAARLAGLTRAVVERSAGEVLDRVGRATGARPLCHDRDHARRVADLTVYLRQSHAERDLAALGAMPAPPGAPLLGGRW